MSDISPFAAWLVGMAVGVLVTVVTWLAFEYPQHKRRAVIVGDHARLLADASALRDQVDALTVERDELRAALERADVVIAEMEDSGDREQAERTAKIFEMYDAGHTLSDIQFQVFGYVGGAAHQRVKQALAERITA